jgi:hypothetical protein
MRIAMLTIRTTTKTGAANRAPSRLQPSRGDDVRRTPALREALLRAEGEYREMPGLSLTLPQAARLWGLDHSTCELVLTGLIERRILKRASNGAYVRR